jgi:hypothetical protein
MPYYQFLFDYQGNQSEHLINKIKMYILSIILYKQFACFQTKDLFPKLTMDYNI